MGRLSTAGARPAMGALLAYALIAFSWAMTNPPFAAPDESEHYLRTVGIAGGTVLGARATDPNPALTPRQRAWTDQASRAVTLPAGLSPAGLECVQSSAHTSAACQLRVRPPPRAVGVTSVGTYQPLPYLLPALALGGAARAPGALRLARLAGLLPWLALLAGALLAVWDRRRGPASLAGPLLALTPMVVFVGASLTGSGLEIVASLAFVAALLRISREPLAPGWAWALAAGSGVALSLGRTLGPAWVAVDLALWIGFTGLSVIGERLRAARGRSVGVLIALAVGVLANRAWEAAHGPHVVTTALPSAASLSAGLRAVRDSLSELVGRFGYLEVRLPTVLLLAWALAAVAAGLAALRTGTRRERNTLAVAVLLCVLAPAYLFAAVTRHTGFGLQGRHYLALVVALALLVGEVVGRGATGVRSPRETRQWPTALAVGAAIVQLAAWWVNARRYAVGSGGSWWFIGSAAWSPPLGWWPWLALMAAACMVLAASARPMRDRGDAQYARDG